MRRLWVFCGSSDGNDPAYIHAAQALGKTLAVSGIGLVYGGASAGLMSVVADAALGAGGEVTGVMPRALVEKEIAHSQLSDLRVVGDRRPR
jgi:uncharacterized protein (TIGR00730 family)